MKLSKFDIYSFALVLVAGLLFSQLGSYTETFIALQFSLSQHITLMSLGLTIVIAFFLFQSFGKLIELIFSQASPDPLALKSVARVLLIATALLFVLRLLYRI
jgi:hypothetical protein